MLVARFFSRLPTTKGMSTIECFALSRTWKTCFIEKLSRFGNHDVFRSRRGFSVKVAHRNLVVSLLGFSGRILCAVISRFRLRAVVARSRKPRSDTTITTMNRLITSLSNYHAARPTHRLILSPRRLDANPTQIKSKLPDLRRIDDFQVINKKNQMNNTLGVIQTSILSSPLDIRISCERIDQETGKSPTPTQHTRIFLCGVCLSPTFEW